MIESEIVIVGGGIAGCSTAFHLASHGRQVVLLERGAIASAASGQNMGGIDSYGWGDAPDLQAHLTAGSIEIFETVQTELGEDIEFRRSGGIQAIHTAEAYEWERERIETLGKRGHVAELLTTREARGIEPGFSPAMLGAMYSPRRGQADPVKATQAFARLAERCGARVLTNHEVVAVAPRPRAGYSLTTSRGEVVAGPDLTIRDGRRVTRHLYGRQRRNGEIIFGGDRELMGYDTTPDPKGIDVNRDHAVSVLPFLADVPIARTWAGLMPFPLDGKPLIGRIASRDNLWIVTGLASSGFGRGPMAGKLLADYLHTGRPAPVLAEADPARCIRERAHTLGRNEPCSPIE